MGFPIVMIVLKNHFGDEKDSVKENYDQVHYLEFAKHVDELVLCTNCDDDVWGRDHTHLEDRISYYKQLLCEEKKKNQRIGNGQRSCI